MWSLVCWLLLICHTATGTIKKLPISLFKNGIVLIWEADSFPKHWKTSQMCRKPEKCVLLRNIQMSKSCTNISWPYEFPQIKVFPSGNSLSELHSRWVISSDPFPLVCVISGVVYILFEQTGNLYLWVEYVTSWWLDILISTEPLWNCLKRMIYNLKIS